jgi:ribosomal protein L28
MITTAEESVSAKPRKRLAAKASVRPSPEKVKVSIVLSTEVDFKLSVHAAALRIDRSALVNQVLADALKRYVVSDRGKTADQGAEVVSAA